MGRRRNERDVIEVQLRSRSGATVSWVLGTILGTTAGMSLAIGTIAGAPLLLGVGGVMLVLALVILVARRK